MFKAPRLDSHDGRDREMTGERVGAGRHVCMLLLSLVLGNTFLMLEKTYRSLGNHKLPIPHMRLVPLLGPIFHEVPPHSYHILSY
jgi:hypothetical protein